MNKITGKQAGRRVLSWLLVLLMMVSAVDISGWGSIMVQAAEAVTVGAFEVTGGTQDTDYSYADGVLTIKTDTALTVKNTDPDTETSDRIYIEAGVSANVILAGVNISTASVAPFEIADDSTGNVTITLADGTNNQLKVSDQGASCAVLQKNGAYSDTLGKLTIQCGNTKEDHICSKDCGALTLTASNNGAGIGSAMDHATADIFIKGGNINASTFNGAGIGGGFFGTGSYIYVSGGCITAEASNSGAGIGGGGAGGKASDIYISGGCITATSLNSGAGVGGNAYGSTSSIYISGGSVNAASKSFKPIGCTPKNNDGEEVYLLTTAENSNNESVYVDGAEYPIRSHSTSDQKLYLYLAGTEHAIAIGENSQEYILNEGQFVPKVKGTDFEISSTDAGVTLTEGKDYSYYTGGLVVKTTKGITVKNVDGSTPTADTISVQKDVAANITLAGVNIESENAAVSIAEDSNADVTIILADKSDNRLVAGNDRAALQKISRYGSLTVTCEHAKEYHDCENSCGKLTAQGNGMGAGIGGVRSKSTGDIVIAGGVIDASGDEGAGIGDGRQSVSSGASISITGGVITANSDKGTGIGAVYSTTSRGIKVIISGGRVTAGSTSSVGIGGYYGESQADVTITGGSIKATSIVGQPHNEKGENVYPLTIDNTECQAIRFDGVIYPFAWHSGTDHNLYIYLTEGTHVINGKTVNYGYSSKNNRLLSAPTIEDLDYYIPDNAVYAGETWESSAALKEDAPYSDDNIVLRYYDSEGMELEDAPINAGTYSVKACFEETEEHMSADIDLGTCTIRPAELKVKRVTAKDRIYDSISKQVEITDITLSGVITGDDVSVKLTDHDDESSSLKAELSSSDVGNYTEVTLPELILTGKDAANYTLIQPMEPVSLLRSVRIIKADAEIIVGSDNYVKRYGDEAFPLEVTDTNADIDVTYFIEEGSDVISIENGVVTIKKTGEALVIVSLPESKNYHEVAGFKQIHIKVDKKEGYTVENIDRSYTEKSEHTDSIDLKTLLPADCGEAVYGTPVITGNVTYSAVPVITNGKLSYTVGQGSAGNEGTIQIGVSTENYADFTITVHTKLTVQATSGTDNPSDTDNSSGGNQDSVKNSDGGMANTDNQDNTANGTTDTDGSQTVKTKTRTVTIPATKKVKGKKKKVTSVAAKAYANDKTITKLVVGKNVKKIGKRAFYGCSNIKTIIIKTEKLKESSIGAGAFKGINKNAVVKVPKKLVKKYKKILQKKGLNKKIKVKAM